MTFEFFFHSLELAHSHSILTFSMWRWQSNLPNFWKRGGKAKQVWPVLSSSSVQAHWPVQEAGNLSLISVSNPIIQFHDHSWITTVSQLFFSRFYTWCEIPSLPSYFSRSSLLSYHHWLQAFPYLVCHTTTIALQGQFLSFSFWKIKKLHFSLECSKLSTEKISQQVTMFTILRWYT